MIQNARREFLVGDTLFFSPTAEDIYMVYRGVCGWNIMEIFAYFQKRIADMTSCEFKAWKDISSNSLNPEPVFQFVRTLLETFFEFEMGNEDFQLVHICSDALARLPEEIRE